MHSQTLDTAGEVRLKDVGQVYKRGDEHEIILRNCSFDITPGKLTVLLGPSGCGKSTLIKLIAGYEKPTMGAITIDGKPVQGPGSDRTVVFQETAFALLRANPARLPTDGQCRCPSPGMVWVPAAQAGQL